MGVGRSRCYFIYFLSPLSILLLMLFMIKWLFSNYSLCIVKCVFLFVCLFALVRTKSHRKCTPASNSFDYLLRSLSMWDHFLWLVAHFWNKGVPLFVHIILSNIKSCLPLHQTMKSLHEGRTACWCVHLDLKAEGLWQTRTMGPGALVSTSFPEWALGT